MDYLAKVWAWIWSHKLIAGGVLLGALVLITLARRSGAATAEADNNFDYQTGGYYVPGPTDTQVSASAQLQQSRIAADLETTNILTGAALEAHKSDNELTGVLVGLQTSLMSALGGQQLQNAHDLGLATIDGDLQVRLAEIDDRADARDLDLSKILASNAETANLRAQQTRFAEIEAYKQDSIRAETVAKEESRNAVAAAKAGKSTGISLNTPWGGISYQR